MKLLIIIHPHQKVEETQVSTDGWVDKQNGVHPHSGILLSHEKGRKF